MSPNTMDRGLEIAASGMLTELVRQDSICRRPRERIHPRLQAGGRSRRPASATSSTRPARPAKPSTCSATAPTSRRRSVDLTQGALEQTGEPLDVALQGPGFLAVQTAQGTRYTRDGQLAVDGQGRLAPRPATPCSTRPARRSRSARTRPT